MHMEWASLVFHSLFIEQLIPPAALAALISAPGQRYTGCGWPALYWLWLTSDIIMED